MAKSTYYEVEDDEWVRVQKNGNRHMCCDCRKVHKESYRIVDGHIEVRVKADHRATAAARRATLRGQYDP